jgi:2-dehydro-3-deoxyphosphogluconate aldolase / (4S)-4-hydroxy-2-oxoglutarate aldolase
MSKLSLAERVVSSGIVGIIRAPDGKQLVDVARALAAGGVDVLEVTFTVPQAHRVLEQVADALGDKVLLGAGTVLDPETCRTAILAGAEFIVSPGTNVDVIRMCKRYSKLSLPGAMTPTEVITAWEHGADFVKVFPCDVLGPAHIRALRGPFPQVRMIPTGGVTLETAAEFLKAGAAALGIGSALVEPKAIAMRDFARIEALAKQYVKIVADARAAHN